MIVINSIIHFLINGISAYSMSAEYGRDSAYAYLFFMLCATVPILPAGIIADYVTSKFNKNALLVSRRFYWGIAVLGILFSLLGMYAGQYALGVGNALVTVGCGLGCMENMSLDGEKKKKRGAAETGLFLASGVPGVLIGEILADFTSVRVIIQNVWIVLTILMTLIGFIFIVFREYNFQYVAVDEKGLPDRNAERAGEASDSDGSSEKGPAGNRKKLSVKEIIKNILLVLSATAAVAGCSFHIHRMNLDWHTELLPVMATVLLMVAGIAVGSVLADSLAETKWKLVYAAALILSVATVAVGMFCTDNILGIIVLLIAGMVSVFVLCRLEICFVNRKGTVLGFMSIGMLVGFLLNHM